MLIYLNREQQNSVLEPSNSLMKMQENWSTQIFLLSEQCWSLKDVYVQPHL